MLSCPRREQSILEYNGAAILAMTGKNCVGICSDSRLGNQAQTVATDFEKIFKMGDKLMVRQDRPRREQAAGRRGVRVLACQRSLWSTPRPRPTRARRLSRSFPTAIELQRAQPNRLLLLILLVAFVSFAAPPHCACFRQVGLPGLATDVITMKELLTFRLNLYRLREEREIKPETFSALMSHILYQKRQVEARFLRFRGRRSFSSVLFAGSGVPTHLFVVCCLRSPNPVRRGLEEQPAALA